MPRIYQYSKKNPLSQFRGLKVQLQLSNKIATLSSRLIEQNNTPGNSQTKPTNNVNKSIAHKLLTASHSYQVNKSSHESRDTISNNDIFHRLLFNLFNIANPNIKQVQADKTPPINTNTLTCPTEPGIKNPTTEEANNILAKSVRNPDNLSN